MTPHDILKRVPKTNCGECGYPACLAFAANVAKSGEDPQKCPYIDLEGFNVSSQGGVKLSQLGRQHDLSLILHLKDKIQALDLAALTSSLKATYTNNALHFPFLGQQVTVSKSTLLVDGEEPEDPRDQILLYNYIHFGGGKPPEPEWIGLESVPNSISKIRTLATYCEQKLATFFTGKSTEDIATLCEAVGGKCQTDGNADLIAHIPVLPQIPQQIHFWDEDQDDGFEAKVKVLYPANVMDYLDIESLVFTSERMAELILTAKG